MAPAAWPTPDSGPVGPSRRAATEAEAKALASVTRVRILRLTLHRALTNRQLAEALGRNPGSVLHHVRTLVDQGFLQPLEPRRGTRGAREVPYRATGKSWLLEVPHGAPVLLETFLQELAAVPEHQVDMARLGLRLRPEEVTELRERMTALLEEFRLRQPAGQAERDGEDWSVFVAIHPDVSA
ncbi:ArsR/SmtB family transcription factor [Ornithinicoccus halotolerans]|uniref:ArsR/SmtB family transcription factor n=1 Tax=Ornithinicoccus halotolerans TaxID=1748220 RepID=UPI0012966CFD|nr:winged helix-turn-helix domain-containing protein [Ornithinicoccus halotolerans]